MEIENSDMTTQRIQYQDSITGTFKTVKDITLDEFYKKFDSKIRKGDETLYLCEWLTNNKEVKLYLDYDEKRPYEEGPFTIDYKMKICDEVLYPAIFKIYKANNQATAENIRIWEYSRGGNGYIEEYYEDGTIKARKYKFSLRFILNIKIDYTQILPLLKSLKIDKIFDNQAYGKSQKLNMYGCAKYKEKEWSHKFEPSYRGMIEADNLCYYPLSEYIVQDIWTPFRFYQLNNAPVLGEIGYLLDNDFTIPDYDDLSEASTASMNSIKNKPYEKQMDQTSNIEMWKDWAINCPNTMTEHKRWLMVGLFMKRNANYECFKIWSSKNQEKYYERDDLKLWEDKLERYPDYNFNIGSMCYIFKEESPERYIEWRTRFFKNDAMVLKVMANPNHHDFANLYVHYSTGDFIYSPVSKWWRYNKNNVLIGEESGYNIANQLLTDITEKLKMLFDEQKNYANAGDEDFLKKMKLYNDSYKKAGSADYVGGCIKYLMTSLCNNEFEKLRDKSHNIFAFNNAVFDVETGEYRDIKRDDFITITCGYSLPDKLDKQKEAIFDSFLHSIFEDEEMESYVMKKIALGLFRYSQKLVVMTGEGGNGKSIIAGLIKNAIGSYFITADSSFLTTKWRSQAPNNSLFESINKRIFVVEEPAKSENCSDNKPLSLNVEFMKMIVDCKTEIQARGCFEKKNRYFKPIFNIFLLCNDIPEVGTGDAVSRRMEVIKFPFVFKSLQQYNAEDPTHRRANNNLCDALLSDDDYRNIFIKRLLKIAFENYKIRDHIIPEKVISKTTEFMESNNWIKPFIKYDAESKPQACSSVMKLIKELVPERGKLETRKALKHNGFDVVKIHGIECFKNLKIIDPENELDSTE